VGARKTIAIIAATLLLAVPVYAWAADASTTPTATYDLSFTLPTVGVSGCTVCHADPNLVRPSGETTVSLYVGPEVMAGTAHEGVLCTGCHIDFAFKIPHENVENGSDWRSVAKSSCKNCHPSQAGEVAIGSHSPSGVPGESASEAAARRVASGKPPTVPACGDCHGSHEIPFMDVEAQETSGTAESIEAAQKGQAATHVSGLEMCGQCHEEYTESYADYYHGAAYQEGALDAPACWDCHGAHQMLPASDRRSPVNPANLIETCGQCHDDANEEYVEYAELIHGREDVEDEIPIYTFWESTRATIEGAVETMSSWFQRDG
jgi:hypothetical protein